MFNCPDLSGCKKFTICFWVKIEDDANITTNWQDIIGFTEQKADNSSTGQLRAETCYNSVYSDTNISRGIHWHDNTNCGITTNAPSHNYAERNIWHHCALVVDSDEGIWTYTNGSLVSNYSYTTGMNGGHLTGQFWLGETDKIQGVINDVRVNKDQILSPREVKEISKGLVCHYTLSGGGGENLIKNSTLSNNTDSWMGGGTPLTSENTTYNSVDCWHVVGELQKYKTLTPYFTVNSTRHLGVQTAGNQYVLSMDVLFENVVKGTTNYYVTLYKSGETIDGTWRNPTVVNNSGHFTSTTGDTLDPSKLNGKGWQRVWIAVEFGDYNWSNANYCFQLYFRDFTGDIYVKNVKIEKGLVATPWTPNSADPLYTKMGLNDGIEYDVSGYGHNGTKTGTITYDVDTPRYWTSSYFNGSSYISTEAGSFGWFNFDQCTISAWMKPTSKPSSYSGAIGLSHDYTNNNKQFSIANHAGIFVAYYNNGSYSNVSSGYELPLNEWHHCAAVLDSTTVKLYVDGILKKTQTIDWGSAAVASTGRIQVGVDFPGSDEKYTGYYSDVRIYMTPLNEADILALYNTPISLSSNGTLLTQGELTEV